MHSALCSFLVAVFFFLSNATPPTRPLPQRFESTCDCTCVIVDEAHVLSLQEFAKIRAATEPLLKKGVRLRVRVYHTFDPEQSFPYFMATKTLDCPSWYQKKEHDLEYDIEVRSNLIVFAISMTEHQEILISGSAFDSKITPDARNHIFETINPYFRKKKIGDGLTKGLSEIYLLLFPPPDPLFPPPKTPVGLS